MPSRSEAKSHSPHFRGSSVRSVKLTLAGVGEWEWGGGVDQLGGVARHSQSCVHIPPLLPTFWIEVDPFASIEQLQDAVHRLFEQARQRWR